MNRRRLLRRLSEGHLNNVRFDDLCDLIEGFGFELLRTTSSHFIYRHPAIEERLNLQRRRGEAKPYQIKQLLDFVEEYDLRLED